MYNTAIETMCSHSVKHISTVHIRQPWADQTCISPPYLHTYIHTKPAIIKNRDSFWERDWQMCGKGVIRQLLCSHNDVITNLPLEFRLQYLNTRVWCPFMDNLFHDSWKIDMLVSIKNALKTCLIGPHGLNKT